MRRVLLMGGLGNQMFQYAFARAYAEKNNLELFLDTSFLMDKTQRENFTQRDYELDIFNIGLPAKDFSNERKKFFKKITKYFISEKIIKEKSFSFDESLLSALNCELIIGYFQTEKYFKNIRDILLKDFHFCEVTSQTEQLVKLLVVSNTVSVHIRRGDYVASEANKNFHGSCSLEYYQNAFEYINDKVNAPLYVFFSDDMDWVREKFSFVENKILVDHNKEKRSFEDMYLMSVCKNNIIANSSFSWWGAWLNKNPNKIVVAPIKWFNDKSVDTRDLIPDEWVRL